MGKFCIPKNLVDQFNNKVLKDNFNIDSLNNMTSKESKEFFTKYTNEELGNFLNTKWESAKVSERETAILDFVKSIYEPKKYTEKVKSNVASKVDMFIKNGVFTETAQSNLLESLIEEQMGISLSNEEISQIVEKNKKLNESMKLVRGEKEVEIDGKKTIVEGNGKLGDANKMKETVDFMTNLAEMNDFIDSLTPSNPIEIFFSQIGILNMVASISSTALNITSNVMTIIPEILSGGVIKSIKNRNLKYILPWMGSNNTLAKEYSKMNQDIYMNTGYDVTRMNTIDDLGQYGSRMIGETSKVHAQGKTNSKIGNFIRWYAKGLQKTVGKYALGYPDFRFANATFVSRINTGSLIMAKGNKEIGTEIMKDAFLFSPVTEEGIALRAQAILDAQTVTNTGETWASNLSMGVKKVLNEMSPVRPGDWMIPFAKTTSNLTSLGTQYTGLGSVIDLGNVLLNKHKGIKITQQQYEQMGQNIVRAGLGFIAARLLVSLIDDDDFSPMFSFGAQQLDTLKNAPENSIRINGGGWISLDYFGPFALPLTAALYGRRISKDNTWSGSFFAETQSKVVSIGQSLPIVDPVARALSFFTNDANREKDPIKEMTASVSDFLGDLSARAVPSFLYQISKAVDTKERDSASTYLGGIAAKTPFRFMLPVKKDIFGKDLGEDNIGKRFPTIMLFGSRLKSDKSTIVVSEIGRVALANDKNINFTDMRKSNSMELAQFKQKVGESMYKDATIEYGQKLEKILEKEINSREYKKMNDQEQFKKITSLDAKALDEIFKKYHFTYKRKK